ncbi:MAG: helix-turn-helix transcriptional regulator [Planctomycetaceae bacterium]|nr:helix-turn-helix transcriptional regulator [Planctomycetaceae bacterium]
MAAAVDDDVAIVARINEFIERHTQADVARRTGTPTTSIWRYVNGGKVPASFCAKLVREMNVNPAWILVGEGAPSLLDAPRETSAMAGSILDLATTLNAVGKLKLGSLVGKDHLKTVRELHNALDAYDKVKHDLNERSRGALGDVLTRLRGALESGGRQTASSLLQAAKQLSRLCLDEALLQELAVLEGRYEFEFGDFDRALDLERHALAQYMTSRRELDDAFVTNVHAFVITLRRHHRYREALRMARVAADLVEDHASLHWAFHEFSVLAATSETSLGGIRAGLSRLNEHLPLCRDEFRRLWSGAHIAAQLYAGVIPLREDAALPLATGQLAGIYLPFARLTDDPTYLGKLYKRIEKSDVMDDASFQRHLVPIACLVEAVTGSYRSALKTFDRFWDDQRSQGRVPRNDVAEAMIDIDRATLLRYGGRGTEARTLCQHLSQRISNLPSGVEVPLLHLAYHHINALKLPSTKSFQSERSAATAFFRERVNKGYLVFRSLTASA